MSSVRILIVTHAQLTPEFGAGQMAINLAEALHRQGNQVTLWSPPSLPKQTKWWQSTQVIRQKLDDFLENQASYDVLDSPAALITPKAKQLASVVVARSVQPDILYIFQSFRDRADKLWTEAFKLLFYYLYLCFQALLVLQGWRRSKYILCLGSLELQWMKKWFPWWTHKLLYYVNALSELDQSNLSKISLKRNVLTTKGIRFLWIGRWAYHKGTNTLIKYIIKRAASNPEDTFTIAGCGPQAENQLPARLVQNGTIKIIPYFDRSQIFSLLESHDIGLFTSKVEGWGLVLNEMLEAGMPIFATQAGGVVDLEPYVRKGLNTFPPSQDIKNSSLEYAVFLENSYFEKFTWDKIAKKYREKIIANLENKNS